MKLTLKSLHLNSRFSRETNCYQATVCVDGVPAFTAENDGGGGSDMYRALPGKQMLLDAAYIFAKSLPPIPASDKFPMDLPMCLELVIGDLIAETQAEKQFVSLTKKYALSFEGGKVWQQKAPKGFTLEALVAHLVSRGKRILNAMPRDEALALFKTATK